MARTNYERCLTKSTTWPPLPCSKGVFNMCDTDEPATDQHTDYVEPILPAGFAMAVGPNRRCMGEMPALLRTHGGDGTAEIGSATRLHFDECNRVGPLRDEIDVPMS